MHSTQNKALHALLSQLGWMDKKRDLVYGATRGRTDQSSELSIEEADILIGRLREEVKGRGEPMRKRVIHLMALMGYTKEDGRPDYVRIDNFLTTRTGARNPKKKALAYLNLKELHACLQQIQTIYRYYLKKLADGNTGDHSNTEGDSQAAGSSREGGHTPGPQDTDTAAEPADAPGEESARI
jgi:hypothetical protein